MIDNMNEEYSKIGEQRANKKIQAVTIVAACIKADTGVGPSIASGSQVCNPIWADFPITPINKKTQIKEYISILKKGTKKFKEFKW